MTSSVSLRLPPSPKGKAWGHTPTTYEKVIGQRRGRRGASDKPPA